MSNKRAGVKRSFDLFKFIWVKLLVFWIWVGRKLLMGLGVCINLLLFRLRVDWKLLIELLILGLWSNDRLHYNRDCWLFCLFFLLIRNKNFFLVFFYYIYNLRRMRTRRRKRSWIFLFFQRWLNYNTWQWERVLNLLVLCCCFLLLSIWFILFVL